MCIQRRHLWEGGWIDRTAKQGHTMSDNGYAYIQAEYGAGNWQTLSTVMNDAQIIAHGMRSLAQRMPGNRIRAVDENGRIVDIL